MKLFVKLFGPLLRFVSKGRVFARLMMAVLVVSIGLCLYSSITTISHETSGWHKTVGLVTREGRQPIDQEENPGITSSLVSYTANGIPRHRQLNLKWWQHNGQAINLWVRGNRVTTADPRRLSKLISRPLLWFVIGAVITGIVFLVLAFLRNLVAQYDKEATQGRQRAERQAEKRAQLEATSKFQREAALARQILELCHQQKETTVTVEEAVSFGPCETGVRDFRDRNFSGRDEVTVGELIPFLASSNALWVATILARKLQSLDLIKLEGDVPHQRLKELQGTLVAA